MFYNKQLKKIMLIASAIFILGGCGSKEVSEVSVSKEYTKPEDQIVIPTEELQVEQPEVTEEPTATPTPEITQAPAPEKVEIPSSVPTNTYMPFYGIWCSASKNYADAQSVASKLNNQGYMGQIFVTSDWSNLNSETWYAVSAGAYESEAAAKTMLSGVQSLYPDAYIKYSGNYQGASANINVQPTYPETIYVPFYGIWCSASKNYADVQSDVAVLSQMGYNAQIFVTSDWSNLNSETWYAVSAGVYESEAVAQSVIEGVRSAYPDAYIKYSGNWQG